jgi:hypothetical protein
MDGNGVPVNGKAAEEGVTRPRCPVCGGPFFILRDFYRCLRCLFSLCVGCEPESKPGASTDEDTGVAP